MEVSNKVICMPEGSAILITLLQGACLISAILAAPFIMKFDVASSILFSPIFRASLTLPARGYLIFNIRSDPFESYDSKDSYGHMAQRVTWLVAPMMKLVVISVLGTQNIATNVVP